MLALQCRSQTGLDGLELVDLPQLKVPSDRVLIDVAAAGVNFADILMTQGKYQEKPELPFVPGLELAGTVRAAGAQVEGFAPGQRVMALTDHGAFAGQALAWPGDVFPLPEKVGFAAAAAMAITYGTTYAALVWQARLRPGETLLVHGAAGGVGAAAVAMGKVLGARVIATAHGAPKLASARANGADHAIESSDPSLQERIRELAPTGVDVVYDPVGGDMFQASMKTIAWEGRILVIGFASGVVPPIKANHLLVKNISVHGLYWGSYRRHDPARLREAFAQLFSWVAEGKLDAPEPTRRPLRDGIAALRDLEARKVVGKMVLEP